MPDQTTGMAATSTTKNLEMPTIYTPEKPPADALKTAKLIRKQRIDESVKRETMLCWNIKLKHSLTWGQCTEFMKSKLEVVSKYGHTRQVYMTI